MWFFFHSFFCFLFFVFNFILFLNLKHCISFAKHQNESTTSIQKWSIHAKQTLLYALKWWIYFHFRIQIHKVTMPSIVKICCSFAKSCLTLCNLKACSLPGSICPWGSPGKNTRVDCYFLLQGIFPNQRSNACLLCWQADSLTLVKIT